MHYVSIFKALTPTANLFQHIHNYVLFCYQHSVKQLLLCVLQSCSVKQDGYYLIITFYLHYKLRIKYGQNCLHFK